MDKQHRAIRAQLSSMAPRRAVAYIRSFELPPDEMACLVECDVRGRSCVQVAALPKGAKLEIELVAHK